MIVHIKIDIVAKFGEKINTGSMIKLSLNLVSIFSQHFSRNIDISDAKKRTFRTCSVMYDHTRNLHPLHTLHTLQGHPVTVSVKLCVSYSRPFGTKPFFAASSGFPVICVLVAERKNARRQSKEANMVPWRPAGVQQAQGGIVALARKHMRVSDRD